MYTFDLRNALVPFSLLDIRHRFKEMRSGESMVVLWGDAGAADDLLRILPAASFDIVSQAEIPGSPSEFRMELTKK
jgi:TusA-related sulfurtransferase